ncbi:MAG: FkbM family methyltransferase [Rhodospirillales bacterium]|nr:FkbM family methyltransferase [Rhodospirillales bacterium]
MHHLARHDEAAAHLRRAVDFSPQTATYRTNLGVVLIALGLDNDAAHQLEQAIALDPQAVNARANLGTLLAKAGKPGQAREMYESALRLKPDFASAHNNLGILLEREGDFPAAAESYRQATHYQPNFADAYANLGHALMQTGGLSEGAAACLEALKLVPDHLPARRNRARILWLQGKWAEAEPAAAQVIAQSPGEAAGHLTLGHVQKSSARSEAAISSYSEALKLSPLLTEAYMALGNLLASEKQLEARRHLLSTLLVTLNNGVRLCVPRLWSSLTPYVLLEQERWFEDEIDFVGRLLLPGEQAIDIGANYGCYTLVMSRSVGGTGRVWAFEPAALTAWFLNASLKENGLSNVAVSTSAVSDRVGSASFQVSLAPELSGLGAVDQSLSTEQVTTTTLDECAGQMSGNDISFVKIDAEGHEQQVLEGGREFFARQSPLVMYEVVEKRQIHEELIGQFQKLGYRSYRLVPGLGVLVPFDEPGLEHVNLLNLFGCKPDRAAVLAARGLLVDTPGELPQLPGEVWKNYLEGTAYCGAQRTFMGALERAEASGQAAYRDAIGWYALSKSETLPLAPRYACLLHCASLLAPISNARDPASVPCVTLRARVALELGWRLMAVELLAPVVARCVAGEDAALAVPAVPVLARLDQIDPNGQVEAWITASVTEAYLRNVDFTSLHASPALLATYEFLKSNPFASPEMTRRRLLIRNRMGLPPDTQTGNPVYRPAPDNLNAEFWQSNFSAP